MIVLDSNILLYAYDSASAHHARAREWVESVFSSQGPIGLPWQTIAAFLRIMTNTRLPGRRLSSDEALEIVDEWLQQPSIRLLSPSEDHWAVLREIISSGQATGPLITDAEIAALTLEYGGILHTTDRDFTRFPGLRWKNPLN